MDSLITCPILPIPQNGRIVECTDSTNFQSTCTFQCMEGFAVVGNSSLLCDADATSIGKWNHMPPTCEGKEALRLPKCYLKYTHSSLGDWALIVGLLYFCLVVAVITFLE